MQNIRAELYNLNSYAELVETLSNHDEHDKGYLFEQFCKALLRTSKDFDADKVFLGKEIPKEELVRLKHPITKKDYGNDGLLIKRDGTRVAFQCKYRSINENYNFRI
jgi:hypothetical protein